MSKKPMKGAAPGKSAVREFQKLTPNEQMLTIAAENLARYGSIAPPEREIMLGLTKRCSRCKKEGIVRDLFGLRKNKDGSEAPQGWCRPCRNSKFASPTRHGLEKRMLPPRLFNRDMLRAMTPAQIRQYEELWNSVSKHYKAYRPAKLKAVK